MTEKLKNPKLAMSLAVIPGFGQFYCHRWITGSIVFILSLCLIPVFPLCLIPMYWGLKDAKTQAELWNQRALLKTIEKNKV